MSKVISQFWKQIRKDLFAGLMVWVPLIVTVWVAWMVVEKVSLVLETLFGNLFSDYTIGLGFLCAIAIFLTTGFLARYWIGKKIIGLGEWILTRIPFISRIYSAVQQISEVFTSRNGTVFQEVCLVEYPRAGMKTVAFITSEEQGIVQATAEKELISVFVPTTPNPTSGYLVFLPRDQIMRMDMKVEEAMKLIVSGGAYLPSIHAVSDDDKDIKENHQSVKEEK